MTDPDVCAAETTPLLVDARGSAVTITLNRAPARNAISRALLSALTETVASLETDRTVRTVTVRGAGGAFCAGADLRERASMSESDVTAFLGALNATLTAIERSRHIYIAAIDGAALGGGLELALACDLRVATPRAVLGLPEVRLGIVPGAGGTHRLPRVLGEARALSWIVEGRRATAEEALAAGLVSEVCRVEDLDVRVDALHASIALGAPLAVAAAKRVVRGATARTTDEGLAAEWAAYATLLPTRDRVEALEAFAEKRPPSFRGE